MLSYHDGTFQFKIKFLKMVRHAGDFTGSFDTMMICEIKYGELVKFRYHVNFPVPPCRGNMLPECISIPAGSWKWNWCKQFNAINWNSFIPGDLSFCDHHLTSQRH